MAYFPNGAAGEVLEAQCHDCPLGHGWNDPSQGSLFETGRQPRPCPVALVQMTHNYGQIRGRGCDETADHLERHDDPPQFVEREGNRNYGSSERQLKTAIRWLRSDDFRDALNTLVDEKGICQVRHQLLEIRKTDKPQTTDTE